MDTLEIELELIFHSRLRYLDLLSIKKGLIVTKIHKLPSQPMDIKDRRASKNLFCFPKVSRTSTWGWYVKAGHRIYGRLAHSGMLNGYNLQSSSFVVHCYRIWRDNSVNGHIFHFIHLFIYIASSFHFIHLHFNLLN